MTDVEIRAIVEQVIESIAEHLASDVASRVSAETRVALEELAQRLAMLSVEVDHGDATIAQSHERTRFELSMLTKNIGRLEERQDRLDEDLDRFTDSMRTSVEQAVEKLTAAFDQRTRAIADGASEGRRKLHERLDRIDNADDGRLTRVERKSDRVLLVTAGLSSLAGAIVAAVLIPLVQGALS